MTRVDARCVADSVRGPSSRLHALDFHSAGLFSALLISALLLGSPVATESGVLVAQEAQRWQVAPEPALEIGRMSGEDAYLFQSVQSARFLPDGRIVVADRGVPAVRVFGSDGRFRHSVGSEGEGPGEFDRVDGMWLTGDGQIGVWDGSLNRISVYSPDGELVNTARIQGQGELPAGNLEVFLGTFPDDDLALATLRVGARPGGQQVVPDPWVVGRFALDGSLETVLGELRGMRRAGGQPVPFSPLPFATFHGDTLFVSDGYGAEISVLDGRGREVRTLELPSMETPAEDAWSTFRRTLLQRAESGLVKRLEALPGRDRVPLVGGLRLDSRGLLWVKDYDPATDALYVKEGSALSPTTGGTWRVYRRDGTPVATVSMPDGVAPLRIQEDRILGVSRDELGVQRVVVHGLRR